MVHHVPELPFDAQVEHERRGRIVELLASPQQKVCVRRSGEELAVGVRKVRVGEHGVGLYLVSNYYYAACPALGDDDTLDLAVQVESYAELGRKPLHRLDERIHPAFGEPEAVLGELRVGEERVDRRRLERGEAQIHRLQRESLPELLGSEELRDLAVVVAQRLRLQQEPEVAQPEEVPGSLEVALHELRASEAVLVAGVFEEAVEARGDAWLYAFEFVYQLGERTADGQRIAVAERYLVVGVERHEADIVVQVAPGKAEELAVGICHQEERWACIEGEAFRLEPSHASADPGVLLEDFDLEAHGG